MPDYRVFGLRVSSELPLPELHPATGAGPTDVTIRLGAPESIPDEDRGGYRIVGTYVLLTIRGIGRYRIGRDGSEILVLPDPAGSERNRRLYLLGSAFGAVLHQRGLLPLHANAIDIGGRAVAFLGHSGAGKSTLAAWFHDRGHRVLADDVCVVALDAAGRPLAHGGIPRLRLWREALEASGRLPADYELSFDDMDKFNVPTEGEPDATPVPLDRIYLLGRAPDGDPRTIEALSGAAAVDALVANTYRGALVRMMGAAGRHLLACAALAGTVPVFSAQRRWGFDRFDAEAEALAAHAGL